MTTNSEIYERECERLNALRGRAGHLFGYFQKYKDLDKELKEELKVFYTHLGRLFENTESLEYIKSETSKEFSHALDDMVAQNNEADEEFYSLLSQLPTSVMSEFLETDAKRVDEKSVYEIRKNQISRGIHLDKLPEPYNWEGMNCDEHQPEWIALYKRVLETGKNLIHIVSPIQLMKTIVDFEDIEVDDDFYSRLDKTNTFASNVMEENTNLLKELTFAGTNNMEGLEDRVQAHEEDSSKLQDIKAGIFSDAPKKLMEILEATGVPGV